MKRFEIEISEGAELDLIQAHDYYEQALEGLGERLIKEFYSAAELLSKNPFLFQKKHKENRELLINPFPYVIVYEIISNKVLIKSVFFCKMNPGKKV